MKKGFSLIEILIVITIFAVLAAAVAQSTLFSLKGSKKSDSSSIVRDNLSFAMNVIERQLRSAKSVTNCSTTVGATQISYVDQDDFSTSFECKFLGSPDAYIASGSSNLTNKDGVTITTCSFTCKESAVTVGVPPTVSVSFSGIAKDNQDTSENSPISLDSSFVLRAY